MMLGNKDHIYSNNLGYSIYSLYAAELLRESILILLFKKVFRLKSNPLRG